MRFYPDLAPYVRLDVASAIAAAYVGSVFAGKALMEDRKAFNLYWLKIAYNVAQIVVCTASFAALLPFYTSADHNFGISLDFNAKIEWWVFVYYCCKVLDLCDTLFIVLEKKSRQLTVLHVWHHGSIIPLFAFYLSNGIGGTSISALPLWNSAVHVIMYGHYLFMSLVPNAKAWWKPLLTASQMGHHVLVMIYMLLNFLAGSAICTTGVFVVGMMWGLSIFLLFLDFYMRSYKKSEMKTAKAA